MGGSSTTLNVGHAGSGQEDPLTHVTIAIELARSWLRHDWREQGRRATLVHGVPMTSGLPL
jgi:hypothetical protein